MNDGAPPVLEVTDLCTHYGRIQALHGVSLRVAKGALVALVGANGAGKTTLLRTLSGVQPASSGKILFCGEDITRLRSDKRVRLGIAQVPEGRQVFGPMPVEDNLMLGAYTRERREARGTLERMYHMFPVLAERRRQAAGTLSGGEQQMLAIGRALMATPRLLLLDEPSMGLAPRVVQLIFEVIRTINAEGVTVLLVEQNARAALTLARRAYVLESGAVILSGEARSLLNDARIQDAYLGA